MIRRGSFLSNGWLVTGSSLAAVALLVFLMWSMGHRPNHAGKTLRLFCAAGMSRPVRDIIQQYEKKFGVTIAADYGGTGELLASIGKVGVKGDLFLSADCCGKTTLLLIAGGLLHPDAGEVRIEGQNIYQLPNEARARFRAAHIGFVFQQFHLVPYLSVRDNVLTPTLALAMPNARLRAEELLNRFGLGPRAHHVPSELSTGERQRTALARALLNQPRLLLADEPTGNLDDANGQIVLQCLADFAKAGGAVLLVTHDNRAAEFAQRTVQLPSRVAESSRPAG